MNELRMWLLIVVVVVGITAPVIYFVYYHENQSDKLYLEAGCEDLRWQPIPKHFLDNGYYVKDGWTCPK